MAILSAFFSLPDHSAELESAKNGENTPAGKRRKRFERMFPRTFLFVYLSLMEREIKKFQSISLAQKLNQNFFAKILSSLFFICGWGIGTQKHFFPESMLIKVSKLLCPKSFDPQKIKDWDRAKNSYSFCFQIGTESGACSTARNTLMVSSRDSSIIVFSKFPMQQYMEYIEYHKKTVYHALLRSIFRTSLILSALQIKSNTACSNATRHRTRVGMEMGEWRVAGMQLIL